MPNNKRKLLRIKKNDGTQTELYFREESNGDEVQITNDGTINFSAISASSFGSNGYVKIGSLYIQWGSVDPGGSYTASVSFPVTFPNHVYQVVVGGSNSTGGGRINCYASSITTSGFTAGIEPGEGPARWIAIGD